MINQIPFNTSNRGPYFGCIFDVVVVFTGRWALWGLKSDSLLSALVMKLLCGMLLDLTVHYGE